VYRGVSIVIIVLAKIYDKVPTSVKFHSRILSGYECHPILHSLPGQKPSVMTNFSI